MKLIIVLTMLAGPVSAFAQYVGDLSPHPYSTNGIGNPFNSGGPYSLSPPAAAGRSPVAPTSPYTWSNVSPKASSPTSVNRTEWRDSSTTPSIPPVSTPRKGPYGITLPGNHPLAIGEE